MAAAGQTVKTFTGASEEYAMSGLDTSQPITDEVVLHEGHVHAEEKAHAQEEREQQLAAPDLPDPSPAE